MGTAMHIPDDSTVKPVTLQPVVALSSLVPFTAHKGSFRELWNTFEFYNKARVDQLSSNIKVRPSNRVANLNLLATCHVPILRSTASDATVANPLVKIHTGILHTFGFIKRWDSGLIVYYMWRYSAVWLSGVVYYAVQLRVSSASVPPLAPMTTR